jgi:hypothetical protein
MAVDLKQRGPWPVWTAQVTIHLTFVAWIDRLTFRAASGEPLAPA